MELAVTSACASSPSIVNARVANGPTRWTWAWHMGKLYADAKNQQSRVTKILYIYEKK